MQGVKDEIFLKALGSRVRELRKKKGLTQVELGVLIENHGEQIGRIERGEINVSSCTLYKISQGLKISLSELFDFEL